MDDDEIFRRSMGSLGVEPLNSAEGANRAGGQPQDEVGERRAFEQAMRDLDDAACDPAVRSPESRPKARRVRAREKDHRIEDQIDLHRLKWREAERRLGRFVEQASRSGTRAILVITGKGHHSPGGRGVLRQRVEEWIHSRGRRRVRAFSEAPRRLGGRGAFVLYLRAVDSSPEIDVGEAELW